MALNDPLALLVAASPAIARTLPARVDVELSGYLTYGRTVIDFYPQSGQSGLAPNCDVVVEFDVGATRRAFVCALDRVAEMHPPTPSELFGELIMARWPRILIVEVMDSS